MASTKPARRFQRKPKRDKDEFFMFKKDIPTVKNFKEKIQKMYDIQIHLDSKVDEGQWLIIFGDPVDRKSSKSYIQAICTPEERKVVQFPMHTAIELSDAHKLEAIEIKTNACIKPLENIAQFEITGSELAVTLALSRLEELVGTSIVENAGDGDFNLNETDVIKFSPSTNCGRKRLSDKLERALSKNSDGGCSVDDYKHAKPSIQRVLLNCLQDDDADDIDDDALFDDGASENANSKKYFKVHIYDDSDETENVDVPDKFTDLNLSDLSDSEQKASDSQAVSGRNVSEHEKYLQDYATSLRFEKQHIEYALTMVDASTRPSDFLSLVQKISTSRGSSVKQSVDVTDEISSDDKANDNEDDVIIESVEEVVVPSPEEAPKVLRKGKNDIPEVYKQMLLRDYQQEDENCPREELKRRNAERQKLLRENFEKQQIDQTPDAVSKKRKKKKNKNKQPQNNTPVEPSTSRTYSNDQEQTCVLRIYDTPQQSGSDSKLDEFTAAVPNRKKDSFQTGPVSPFRPASNQGQKGFPRSANMPVTNQGMKEYSQYSNIPNTNQGNNNPFTQPSPSPAKNQGQGPVGFSGSPIPQSPQGRTNKPMQAVVPVQKSQSQGPVDPKDLRSVVIDGSNVAMTHGNGKIFSCRGIQICVDYFKQRGHGLITVFVPNWRNCRPGPDNHILDQEVLQELKDKGVLVFTPSRKIGKRMVAAYDDRFVLELAEAEDAIIVSNDQYRDLMEEKAIWKNIIQTRLLMYSFVRDLFMPPNDPLGRNGPNLDDFLRVSTDLDRFAPYAPYQQYQPKMNYPVTPKGRGAHQPSQGYYQAGPPDGQNYNTGNKNNPSSPYKPVIIYSDEVDGVTKPHFNTQNKGLRQNQGQGQNVWANTGQGQNAWGNKAQEQGAWANNSQGQSAWANTGQGQSAWQNKGQGHSSKNCSRSEHDTQELLKALLGIFPEQEDLVRKVLSNHMGETNLEKLANYCVGALAD